MSRHFRLLLLASTTLTPLCASPAYANPLGGQVVGGSANIAGQGSTHVTVTQTTPSAIINWNTFNIGAGETTRFVQPGATSVILDRVTGGAGPSTLSGNLISNGQVYLVNPDGVLVGPTGRIQTGGFLATTHDISNADFMAGRYRFTQPGRPDASVVNEGTITATTGGFAALVAPGVRNDGVITARLGKVALASGNGFSLDFYGDRLVTLGVSDSIAAQVKDVATGKPLASLVSNAGAINANGGTVQLSAVVARKVVDSVINNKGVIEANSIGRRNGMIVLGGATGADKPAGAPTQLVRVSGRLSASGRGRGTKGGTVVVTGEAIKIANARIDASGVSGGGKVLIGGDWAGGHPTLGFASNASATLESAPLLTATRVSLDARSKIDASAKETGNGGKVIVWADQSTTFDGSIIAHGGVRSGDGGFVETSGKQTLSIQSGLVDTNAPNGKIGDWLLDPAIVVVSQGGTASLSTVGSFGSSPGTTQFIDPSTIASSFSNVTLQATSSIYFNAPVTMIHDHVGLTAQAGQSIYVEPGASITTRGGTIAFSANYPVGPSQQNGSIGLYGPLYTNGGGLTGGPVYLNITGGTGTIGLSSTAGGISTSGGLISFIGAPVVLVGPDALTNTLVTMDTTGGGSFSPGASINFASALNGYFFGRQHLTLASGASDISFGDNVFIGGLTIASARNVSAAGYITASSFFTDMAQTGNLTVPGGISTAGDYSGTNVPQAGNQNAGAVNISANGDVTIGTDRNSTIYATGGYVASTGAGGNGADINVRAGGTLTLSAALALGGNPKNGSTLGGNAGNITLTAPTISLLGYAPGSFSGQNLLPIALGASGGPSSDTQALLPPNIAGRGGNITLNGNVVLRGGPGTSVLIANDSNGANANISISGQVNAASAGADSLFLENGHGQVSVGNVGATASLNSFTIADNLSATVGSVSATSLTRYFSTSIPSLGPTTTSFSGPVDVSGDAYLVGANLLFASSLRIGGNATFGSVTLANLTAGSVTVGGHTTLLSDTAINTSQSNGSISMGAIDGTSTLGQTLTLSTGQGQFTHGDIGVKVALKGCTVNGALCVPSILIQDPILSKLNATILNDPQGGLLFPEINTHIANSTLSTLPLNHAIINAILNPTNGLNYLTEPQLESVIAMAFGSLISRLPNSAEFTKQARDIILKNLGTLDDPISSAALLIPINIALSELANKAFIDPTSNQATKDYGAIVGGVDRYSDQVVVNTAIAYIDELLLAKGNPKAVALLVNPDTFVANVGAGIVVSTITDVFQLLVTPTPVY